MRPDSHRVAWFLFLALTWAAQAAYSQLSLSEEREIAQQLEISYSRLDMEDPQLTEVELGRLAEAVTRSNYIANAVRSALHQTDFTNAARLLAVFPGKIDDLQSAGRPLLQDALYQAKVDQVDFLLQHKADPNRAWEGGERPLTWAMAWGPDRKTDVSIPLQLLEGGASATLTNGLGQPPLPLLFRFDWEWHEVKPEDPRWKLLDELLNRGADGLAPMSATNPASLIEDLLSKPNYPDPNRKPLTRGILDVADLLLTNRPSPARRTLEGNTALHLAAIWGRTNAIEFLLAHGFGPDQTNSHGLTPLQLIATSTRGPSQKLRFMNGDLPQAYPSGFEARAAAATVDLLLRRGAALDVFCAAGLGRTNELATMLRKEPNLANARDGLGGTPLHYAVDARQVAAVRLLLAAGAERSPVTRDAIVPRRADRRLAAGITPLHLAALQGEPEILETLLQAGAPVNVADGDGNIPLHLNALNAYSDPRAASLLLAAHAALDVTNHANRTPLHLAVEAGAAQTVEALLKAGASPTLGVTNGTLLHLAARRLGASPQILQALTDHGLKLEDRDDQGRTAFRRAIEFRNWGALTWLQANGAKVDAMDPEGNTALHFFCAQQNDTVAHLDDSVTGRWKNEWLSSDGAKQQVMVHLLDWKLLPARSGGTRESSLTIWLLDHRANPNITNRLGQTPLAVFCAQNRLSSINGSAMRSASNCLARLLKAGARPDLADTRGVTPLHLAASNAPPELLKLLLQRVRRPGPLQDIEGRTPLDYAATQSQHGPDCLLLLLQAGLDPNRPDPEGRALLHRTIDTYFKAFPFRDSTTEVTTSLSMLLTNRANPNLQDGQGRTPLHIAMQSGYPHPDYDLAGVVSLLLTNGAAPGLRDNQGRTPLHLLAASSHQKHPGELLDRRVLAGTWDFTARDKAGQTPIHVWATNLNSSCRGCVSLLRTVLTNQALLSLTNAAGDTPLHAAIAAGQGATAELLLAAGADPALTNGSGESVYRLATRLGGMAAESVRPAGAKYDLFPALIKNDRASLDLWFKADPGVCSVTNKSGETPLEAATKWGHPETVERLLTLGARMDLLSAMRLGRAKEFQELLPGLQGQVPSKWLFEAVGLRREAFVREMVTAGGDPMAVDSEGHSLLYRAATSGQTNLAAWLETRNARETVFDAIARGKRQALLAALDADPAAVNATNSLGVTALIAAVETGQEELVSLLLERGAPPDLPRYFLGLGWTPLHCAAAKDFAAVASALLRAGADPNRLARGGVGPLHLAAALNCTNTTALLLDSGAEVNLKPPPAPRCTQNTPLHWAAQMDRLETAKLLIEHGADPKALNNVRQTPAELVGAAPPPGADLPFWPGPSRALTEDERQAMMTLLKAGPPVNLN